MTRNIYNQTGYIDNLIVNGSLDSNLIPLSNLTYTLGDSSYKFNGLYTDALTDSGNGNLYVNSNSFTSNFPLNVQARNNINDLVMLWNDHTGTNRWSWQLFSTDGINFNDMEFTEVGVADGRLYLKHGGTVGINTTNPNSSYALDVETSGVYINKNGITLGNSSVSGYTPTALQVYEEDSAFGIDWTGPFSVSQAQNVQFIIVGSQVTLQVPAFQSAASATGRITNLVTLPTRFIPGTTIIKPIDVYNNSTLTQGRIQIDTSGNIIIGTDINLSVFTSTGNAGWEGFTFTYTVL